MNIAIQPGVIAEIGGFPITNTMAASWLCAVLVFLFFWQTSRKAALVPRGVYNGLEAAFEYFVDLTEGFAGGRDKAMRILPLAATLFFFILVANLIGMLPIFGQIEVERAGELIPLFRTPTSDYNLPLALALIMFVVVWSFSISRFGVFGHVKKYLPFELPASWSPMGLFEYGLKWFLGIMDIVSDFARVVSMSMRLFGNLLSAEVLAAVIAGFAAFVVPSTLMVLGLISGLVQAVVFSMLTVMAVRIGMGEMAE
jgi:F-type H+-transporting ATPase subunit a